MKPHPAALGLRAKSGRAVLVALGGTVEAPRLLLRRKIPLTTRERPDTFQPFHAVLELPWEEAVLAARATEAIIEDVAAEAVRGLIQELRQQGHGVAAVGVVGSPDRDLLRMSSRHIRSHAAEGLLFRRVLEVAAKRHGIPARTISDRETEAVACSLLSWPAARLEEILRTLGRAAGPPWRADERMAATAALLGLATWGGP